MSSWDAGWGVVDRSMAGKKTTFGWKGLGGGGRGVWEGLIPTEPTQATEQTEQTETTEQIGREEVEGRRRDSGDRNQDTTDDRD